MPGVNRSLMVVKPKQPFLDWLNSLDNDDEMNLTLEELQNDSTAYLVPEYETPEDQAEIVVWSHNYVFEEELMAWYTFEEEWPPTRDLDTFLEWFEVEFHSTIMDLDLELPLEHVQDDDEVEDDESEIDPSSNGH
ncbi:MAG TPA: hypothetical protein VLB68_13195 [Pyrinomonadaceae bacterium]|nr:hypothetical protein [Pyrinomonadaceae bacterium]